MACPHAAPVPHWPWSRGAGASARDCRSRGEPHRDAHKTQAHCGAARVRCAVAGAPRGYARARRAAARCADARAHHTADRRANARARRAVVEARRAVHSSCARPSPQSAAGARALASLSASRICAHPTAAAHRGHRWCRSVEHTPSCCPGGGRNGRAGRPSLAPDLLRPVAGDRDSHGCGRRAAPGPSRHGGRAPGYDCAGATLIRPRARSRGSRVLITVRIS